MRTHSYSESRRWPVAGPSRYLLNNGKMLMGVTEVQFLPSACVIIRLSFLFLSSQRVVRTLKLCFFTADFLSAIGATVFLKVEIK